MQWSAAAEFIYISKINAKIEQIVGKQAAVDPNVLHG
jgi:hypothetical protein